MTRLQALFAYCRTLREQYRWGYDSERGAVTEELFDEIFPPTEEWTDEHRELAAGLELFYDRLIAWRQRYSRDRKYMFHLDAAARRDQ